MKSFSDFSLLESALIALELLMSPSGVSGGEMPLRVYYSWLRYAEISERLREDEWDYFSLLLLYFSNLRSLKRTLPLRLLMSLSALLP